MWRTVAIGLLAVNLLFLAWSQWVAPDRTPPPAASPPPVAAAPVPPALPPPAERCVSLGPFPDAAAAATVAQRLTNASLQPRTREERRPERDGYWVVVAAPDAAAQRRLLAQIRRAGVQDAYAMPDDPLFRISLGIYSDRGRAEQRAGTLSPLGMAAAVEEHFEERVVQWLDVPSAGDQLSASRLEGFGITDSDVGAFDCPPATQ
jgi:hypothetical protein